MLDASKASVDQWERLRLRFSARLDDTSLAGTRRSQKFARESGPAMAERLITVIDDSIRQDTPCARSHCHARAFCVRATIRAWLSARTHPRAENGTACGSPSLMRSTCMPEQRNRRHRPSGRITTYTAIPACGRYRATSWTTTIGRSLLSSRQFATPGIRQGVQEIYGGARRGLRLARALGWPASSAFRNPDDRWRGMGRVGASATLQSDAREESRYATRLLRS